MFRLSLGKSQTRFTEEIRARRIGHIHDEIELKSEFHCSFRSVPFPLFPSLFAVNLGSALSAIVFVIERFKHGKFLPG